MSNKIILVTGANTGIGFELVRLLAEKGHVVYLGARDNKKGQVAAEQLHSEGHKAVKFVLIDVTQPSTIQAAKETIETAEGRLDVLVNNAGIAKFGHDEHPLTIQRALVEDTIATNLYGLMQTCQVFVPLLRKSSNGVIVNVSTSMASNAYHATSDHHLLTGLHFVAYNTSKAAANSYSVALAKALKPEGIKVIIVTPGFTTTQLNQFHEGGKTPKEGALAILPWALLDKDGPTCKYVDWNGDDVPW